MYRDNFYLAYLITKWIALELLAYRSNSFTFSLISRDENIVYKLGRGVGPILSLSLQWGLILGQGRSTAPLQNWSHLFTAITRWTFLAWSHMFTAILALYGHFLHGVTCSLQSWHFMDISCIGHTAQSQHEKVQSSPQLTVNVVRTFTLTHFFWCLSGNNLIIRSYRILHKPPKLALILSLNEYILFSWRGFLHSFRQSGENMP